MRALPMTFAILKGSVSPSGGSPAPASKVSEAFRTSGTRRAKCVTESGSAFTTLWVIAFSCHYLDSHPLYGVPVLVLVLGTACLLAPAATGAFVIFLLASTIAIALDLPALSNHSVLALLVNAILVGSIWTTSRHADPCATSWPDVARAPALMVLLSVYLFAVFHKLNVDFFDPATSCAGVLAEQGLRLFGVQGQLSPATAQLVAIVTVGWESTLLLLLAVARFQHWGVLLGLAGHIVLAFAMFFDFATYIFAIYILLLSRGAGQVPRCDRWRQRGFCVWLLFVVIALAGRSSLAAGTVPGWVWHATQAAVWVMMVALIMGPTLVSAWRASSQSVNVQPPFRVMAPWLFVVPLLGFANGLTAYLGIKTVANYSMFSNLRTEGGVTNHMLPGLQALEVVEVAHDVAIVYDFQVPSHVQVSWLTELRGGTFWLRRQTRWLQEPRPVTIPWLELRRAVWLWKTAGVGRIQVAYERNGVRRRVEDATTDPELAAPLSWWARQFVAFRAIQPSGEPVRCRW